MDKEIGIYRIINLVNQKYYLGSSKNIQARWKYEHLKLLRNNKHENIKLQRAWNKYGEINFKLEILEYCQENELRTKEQHYLNELKPWASNIGYNISAHATGGDTLSNHPDLEKIKLKLKQNNNIVVLKGELNPRWSGGRPKCLNCGKTLCYGNKRCKKCAFLKELNPFFGKKHSEETKNKLRLHLINNPIPNKKARKIKIYGIIYESISKAAKALGMKVSTLSRQLREGRGEAVYV